MGTKWQLRPNESFEAFARRVWKVDRGTTMAGNDTKECPHTVITEDKKFCMICGVRLETLKNNVRPEDRSDDSVRRSVGNVRGQLDYLRDEGWQRHTIPALSNVQKPSGDDSNKTQLSDAAERDNVNGPEHYQHRDGVQTIDVVHQIFSHEEFITCMVYNVIKYVARYKRKGGLEDLKKAERYVKWAIEEMETGKISHE